jgi:hypothetical protein
LYYAFETRITEEKIMGNVYFVAEHRQKVPLEYFIVDDGWCLWGDWIYPNMDRFPTGVKGIGQKIRAEGFKLGLWYCPYQVDPKARIAKEHPEWIATRDGKPVVGFAAVNVGEFHFGQVKYLLDFKNEDVKNYIRQCIDMFVQEWKVELLKLDYLFGPYLYPQLRDFDEAHGEVVRLLDYIRQKYPSVHTIGAAAPFADLVGRVDSAYFSENIIIPGLAWIWPLNRIYNGMRLARLEESLNAKKGLRGAFVFDPDVFVCSQGTGLTDGQIEKLLLLTKNLRGNKVLGDDLTLLARDRVEKYIYPLFT